MTKKLQLNEAFTLIELLVVISIIGILIGLSIFGLQGARASARDVTRRSDLEQIRIGLETYKIDCNNYPASNKLVLSSKVTLKGDDSTPSCPSGNTYISLTPLDPSAPGPSYVYSSAGTNTYELCAALEQGSGSVTCGGSSACGGKTCNYKVTNP